MENRLFAACFSFYGAESGRHPPVLLQQRLNLKVQAFRKTGRILPGKAKPEMEVLVSGKTGSVAKSSITDD